MTLPHGYYHVSWGGHPPRPVQLARQLADLKATAQAGLRLWHGSHLQDVAHTRRLLDLAQSLGVGVLLEDVDPGDREALRHPALHALSVADDANRKSEAELLRLCEAPGLRYISVGAEDGAAWCYGRTEIIGVQLYPYPYEPLAAWWPALTRARELADEHGQRLYANLQVHANGHGKPPSAGQVRALGWMAAAAGVDGVLWYAQQDGDGSRVTPALHRAVRAVAAEHRELGQPHSCTRAGDVLTARWAGGPVVRLNLARSQVLSVKREQA